MKLKHIIRFLCTIFSAIALVSCNDDSTYTVIAPSADAQIYSFTINSIPRTAIDTATYPALSKTLFSIDQFRSYIYNADSLPYQTSLRKLYVNIGLTSNTPSKIELIYPDSVVSWNATDSVDFSKDHPRFRVTAENGSTSKEYTIDIRIHQIDPDTLIWHPMTAQPSTVGRQKTLLKDDKFHTFSIEGGNTLSLYTADKSSTLSWSGKQPTSGINASRLLLNSITLFAGKFYAADLDMKTYTSEDGISWTAAISGVYNIMGILPGETETDDVLLVIKEDAGKYYYATTKDMQTLTVVEKITTSPNSNEVDKRFPAFNFSSVTNYNRSGGNTNLLAITGGRNMLGNMSNLTWSVRQGDNGLEVISIQNNPTFAANPGIASFLYDGYLFAMTQSTFYKSDSWGYKWIVAPTKESVIEDMPKASGQSIIVDDENNIWVFGGVLDLNGSNVHQVWKGRINRLNP